MYMYIYRVFFNNIYIFFKLMTEFYTTLSTGYLLVVNAFHTVIKNKCFVNSKH